MVVCFLNFHLTVIDFDWHYRVAELRRAAVMPHLHPLTTRSNHSQSLLCVAQKCNSVSPIVCCDVVEVCCYPPSLVSWCSHCGGISNGAGKWHLPYWSRNVSILRENFHQLSFVKRALIIRCSGFSTKLTSSKFFMFCTMWSVLYMVPLPLCCCWGGGGVVSAEGRAFRRGRWIWGCGVMGTRVGEPVRLWVGDDGWLKCGDVAWGGNCV